MVAVSDQELLAAPATGIDPAPARVDPDDVAYVLFTSGSTGRPKGVPIRHRNVVPFVERKIRRLEVTPASRVSQTYDLTFDPSVFDLFVAWGAGALLVVPQKDELLRPIEYVERHRLTHWSSVPSLVSVAQQLGQLPPGRASSLRFSVFCGEQLTYEQAATWAAVAPASVIENMYGPTELTICVTEYRLPAAAGRWPQTANGTVPIGLVHDDLEAVLLDAAGHEQERGELCVRGHQRFDGYLDRADDEGRFVLVDDEGATPLPGGEQPAEPHYYRTGDCVQYEHGVLVHVGRLDDQVKIRGMRVELGEIETVLRRRPGLVQGVVLVGGVEHHQELFAVYTGAAAPASELRAWMRGLLPQHMVPRRYHHLDALPMTPNGKIDRAGLRKSFAQAPAR